MRTTIFLGLLSIASLPLAGCGEPSHEDLVQEYIASSGQQFSSCGALEFEAACAAPDADEQQAGECLLAAFQECKPARLDVTHRTEEGKPVYITYLVLSEGDHCGIQRFVDDREDPHGAGEATQAHCDSVRPVESCSIVEADGCIGACSKDTDCG